MANKKSYMKKTIAKNRKQGRGLTKTFAFGGFEFDTPQEAIMNNNKAQAQATIDTMEDSGLQLMRGIGTGFNIAGQLVGQYGSMFAGAGAGGDAASEDAASEGAAPGGAAPGGKMTGMQKLANTKFGKGIQSMVYASGGQVPSFDTKLSKLQEKKYQKWKKTLPENLQYEGDYDLRGFWKENPKWTPESVDTHMTDKYKKPNHPTFSNESQYHTEDLPGGSWDGEQFTPATWQQTQYAMGGAIPVEVEGNEMGQLPNGQMLDFQGPSHEQGGIPIDLPTGTKIYSDRVSIDGKTMAQRKASREGKIKKLENKIGKGDRVAKNTLDRYMLTAGKEEALDMSIQQMLNEADNNPQFAKGGLIKSGNKTYRNGREVHSVDPVTGEFIFDGKGNTPLSTTPTQNTGFSIPKIEIPGVRTNNTNVYEGPFKIPELGTKTPTQKITVSPTTDKYELPLLEAVNRKTSTKATPTQGSILGPNQKEVKGLPLKTNRSDWTFEEDVDKFTAPPPTKPIYYTTDKYDIPLKKETPTKTTSTQGRGFGVEELVPMLGNALGIYGNYKAGIADEKAYLQAKASQTANTNAYKHYGKEALKTLDESKLFAKQMGDIQRSEVELARKTATDQNRKTARGINTMRALDLASQAGANRLDMQAYAQEAKQIQEILGQEANLKQQIDQVVMSGEESRDLRDRDDKVNLLNMQTRADISKGNMYSNIGKNINDMAENSAALNSMNDAYGSFKYTPGGRLRSIPGNAGAIDLVKDAKANPSKYKITDAQAKLWGNNDAIWVNYLATNGLIQPKKEKEEESE